MDPKGTVRLETDRLVLRRFTMADAPAAFRNWMNDAEVTRFLKWPVHGEIAVTERVIGDWISHYDCPNFYLWAIVLKESGEPIGSISVVGMDERAEKVHIGYCIGKKWWHCGFTSEAFTALIRFFFEQVRANRIEARHDLNNPNSGRVMVKCGLLYEGTLRQADWNNQGIVDVAMYGITASDYFQRA